MDSGDDKEKRGMADGERDSSIWSIRPRMRTAYLLTFAALFGGSLAYLAATGRSPETIMGLAGSVAIGSAGAAMFIAEAGGYVMVLVDAAIAWRDKKFTERVRKAADRARAGSATDDPVTKAMAEALAKAESSAEAKGRAEERHAWRAWHERREAAQARGEPFDEPAPDERTPGVNGRSNST